MADPHFGRIGHVLCAVRAAIDVLGRGAQIEVVEIIGGKG